MAGAPPARSDKGLLQVLTELAGLLAAGAAVIYGAGAVVLSLRLASEQLPWSNIVSGLPREFLISTGAGQVLLPSLGVGALYALYRARGKGGATPPAPIKGGRRQRISERFLQYVLTLILLFLPLGFVWLVRGITLDDKGVADGLRLGLGVLLLLWPFAVLTGRDVAIRSLGSVLEWNSVRGRVRMAVVYAAAAMPAMILAAAVTPLTSAKVCMAGGGEQSGKLVGESSDRVYMGEAPDTPEKAEYRRIVVIPMAKIDQLFVGPHPTGAVCEKA